MNNTRSWEWRTENVKVAKKIWLFFNDAVTGIILGVGMFTIFFHVLPQLIPGDINIFYIGYAWVATFTLGAYGVYLSKEARR